MTEIVLRRLTCCPSGKPGDVRALEIVMELDDPLPITDRTPRTVTVKRIYSRGDLSVLAAHGYKSVSYAALGFAPLIVTAERHVASEAFKGATVRLWTDENPKQPGRKLPINVNWTGVRHTAERIEPQLPVTKDEAFRDPLDDGIE